MPSKLIEAVGGLPFVSSSFLASDLATYVAAYRRGLDKGPQQALQAYLDPTTARRVFVQFRGKLPELPESVALSPLETARIGRAIDRIGQMRPDWWALFAIPIEFRKWVEDKVSVTNPFVPQVVMFGSKAFLTRDTLLESIIHEMSHIWLSFLIELGDVQNNDYSQTFVLPSGTPNKTARGVLFAAHFAASVLDYILGLPEHEVTEHLIRRREYLRIYLPRALDLIVDDQFLTPAGVAMRDHLRKVTATIEERMT